jgi:hypothetical protein
VTLYSVSSLWTLESTSCNEYWPNFIYSYPLANKVVKGYSNSCAAILVRGRDHQTQFWKRIIQWLFYQSLVPIEQLVPDKKIFMSVQLRCYWKQLWSRWEITGSWEPLVNVKGQGHRVKSLLCIILMNTWINILWLFHPSLVLIELLVPDKMVFMWISHRVLC